MAIMEDEDRIKKILARDRRTLYFFYQEYAPQLSRIIQTKVANVHDAEEILQDTLFAFLEAIRDFHGKAKISTFLFAICRNKIVDHYRKKKVRQVLFSQMPNLETLISPLIEPEAAYDAMVLKERLNHTLERILPQYAHIIRSRYFEGLSVVEIAHTFAISFKSAESMIFRAKKAFVQAFQKTDYGA